MCNPSNIFIILPKKKKKNINTVDISRMTNVILTSLV